MVPVVSITGYSGSGKTTFLEKLIPALAHRGIVAAVVKHTCHDISKETKGKDTSRLLDAGAAITILHSGHEAILYEKAPEEFTLLDLAQKYGPGVDIVLGEGYKSEKGPKIEISRKEASKELIFKNSPALLAVAADYAPDVDVPVFDIEDGEGVADFLIALFELQK